MFTKASRNAWARMSVVTVAYLFGMLVRIHAGSSRQYTDGRQATSSAQKGFMMSYNEDLAQRVRATLAEHDAVDEKKMFGGLAFMLNGNMCCGIIRDDLMVRVGSEQSADALAQPHVRELDFTGRPMRGMIVVDADGLTSNADLEAWVRRGVTFVAGLPAK
jgi:TfoX/Sxy family transcriptional regulator of competence genes